MSHVGFADSYDPPDADFDVDAALDDADRVTGPQSMDALRDIERIAIEWDAEYGLNEGKLSACERNPWLPLLNEAFDTVEYFYPQLREELRVRRGKLGL